MHVTMHMTTGCNMKCDYCYSPPTDRRDMTLETARQTIDFIEKYYPHNTGIIFFGGEPLLRKDLIQDAIEYCKLKRKSTGAYFHFKTTTNGLLLDEEFLDFSIRENLQISISIDGNEAAHNACRKRPDGSGTFDVIVEKSRLLLRHMPYAKALMTVSPESLPHYADSVRFLMGLGFKYLIVSLNYAGNWRDEHLKELRGQYKQIAKIYHDSIMQEKKFYFSPFEMKFAGHIRQENAECYRCHLGVKQISVGFDGLIYPCVQFVKDGVSNTNYSIGHVKSGIDSEQRDKMYVESRKQIDVCSECDLNPRCNNKCSCLNWQLTGQITDISPLLCETERILLPIVDKLGEKLYRKKAPMFIQKHYNAVYPIMSMIEDAH